MKRRTIIIVALVGLAVLLLALGWRGLPNMRTADREGRIPRFTWIAAGDPRPTPGLPHVFFGLGPLVSSPRVGPRQMEHADRCREGPAVEACTRRNWLAFLARFGASELTSAPDENSYRFFRLPSFRPWTMAELHVPQDGKGVMEIATQGGESDQAPAVHRRVLVDPKGAVSFERKLQASDFGRIAVDPRALLISPPLCYDGVSYLFEAQVRGYYRYAVRHTCEVDENKVQAWGDAMLRLEKPPT